jgi:hypothetical protein
MIRKFVLRMESHESFAMRSAAPVAHRPRFSRRRRGDTLKRRLMGLMRRQCRRLAYEFDGARVDADCVSLILTMTAIRLIVPLR